jgi:hypothetical protein
MYRSEQGKSAPSIPSLVTDQYDAEHRSGTVIVCAIAARDGTLVTASVWVKQTMD